MPITYEIAFRLPVSQCVKTEGFPEEIAEEWENQTCYEWRKNTMLRVFNT